MASLGGVAAAGSGGAGNNVRGGAAAAAAGGGSGNVDSNSGTRRRLVLQRLAGYQPRTQVTDEAALDQDQAAMEEELFLGKILKARNVYSEGGHSSSYAELKLVEPSGPVAFKAGTDVYGKTPEGGEVFGTLMDDVAWSDANSQNVTLRVRYQTSDVQGRHVGCQVGGLYTFSEANRDGWYVEVLPSFFVGFFPLVLYSTAAEMYLMSGSLSRDVAFAQTDAFPSSLFYKC